MGCSTSGEIADGWAGSGHVVALALGGEGLTVRTSVGRLADGAREAGRTAARGLEDVDRPHQVLMLLSDGMAGPRSDVVRGAYGVAGAAVPLVGGCAGDDLAMRATYQLCDGEVLTAALEEHGPCPQHRFSYVNVARRAAGDARVPLRTTSRLLAGDNDDAGLSELETA